MQSESSNSKRSGHKKCVKTSKRKKQGNEQAILDACWSERGIAKKLKLKMEEQMQHIKKVKTPFTKRAPEEKIKGGKNKSRVMMVEESERIYPTFVMRHNSSSSNLKVTPLRVSRNLISQAVLLDEGEIKSSYATEEPSIQYDTSLEEDTSPLQSCIPNFDRDPSSLHKETIAYNALKKQLNRITLELRREDSEQDLGKQRRTREDRKIRLKQPVYTKEQILGRLNRSQDAIKITDEIVPNTFSHSKMKHKSKVGKPHTRNSFKKVIHPTKENARPITKLTGHTNTISSKKHVTRKYLGELYTRIIFKVREIEREKKMNPHKNRALTSRQDTTGVNSLKKLIFALKNKNTHK
jgi:hypothetical protein